MSKEDQLKEAFIRGIEKVAQASDTGVQRPNNLNDTGALLNNIAGGLQSAYSDGDTTIENTVRSADYLDNLSDTLPEPFENVNPSTVGEELNDFANTMRPNMPTDEFGETISGILTSDEPAGAKKPSGPKFDTGWLLETLDAGKQ